MPGDVLSWVLSYKKRTLMGQLGKSEFLEIS